MDSKDMKEVFMVLLVPENTPGFEDAMVPMLFFTPPEMKRDEYSDGAMVCEDDKWRRDEDGMLEVTGTRLELDDAIFKHLISVFVKASKKDAVRVALRSKADGKTFLFTRKQVEGWGKEI